MRGYYIFRKLHPCMDASSDAVIDVRSLTKQYGSFTALDHLDMTVGKGEFMGLLGPNGAGKSTTLKSMTGLVRPTSGNVFINGVDAVNHREAMKHVGCVIETPECYSDFTPGEMLAYVGAVHGMNKGDIAENARAILDEVRMWEWRNKKIGQFSKGMRQRVAIAAALLPNPDVIILDEPTSGLDPRGMIEIRAILNGLKNRGLTLLISTHILSEVSEMCTSMTMINRGKKIISGNVSELLHNLSEDSKEVSIELRTIGEMGAQFCSDLEAMAGVADIDRMGPRSVRFKFTGTDEQQADIADLVQSYKLRMLCMNETGADLESLYMQLTAGDEVNVK